MTEHSYFADRISAYHDGYLPGQELELIRRHLEECEECRRALADFEKLDRMVDEQSQLDGEEYWEKSAQRIEQRIAESSEEKVTDIRRSRFGTFGMRIAAVAASFLIIGYIALHESDILSDFSDTPPMDKPVMKAPAMPATKVVPVTQVVPAPTVDSAPDVELASPEQPVELVDVEIDEVRSDMPVASRGVSDGKGVLDKKEVVVEKSAADKKGPPVAMEPDRLYVDDAVVVSIQGIEPVAIKPAAMPPADQATSSDLAEVEGSQGVVESEVAEVAAQPDKAMKVRGERDVLDFALSSETLLTERAGTDQSADTSLTEWREIRDQNSEAYPQVAPDMAVAFNADAAKSKASRQRTADDSDTVSSEELLLRAWYQIALNTDDPDERVVAVSFLKQYLKDEDARFPALVEDYLDELGESSE